MEAEKRVQHLSREMKLPYSVPELTIFGTLQELTRTTVSLNKNADGGTGTANKT